MLLDKASCLLAVVCRMGSTDEECIRGGILVLITWLGDVLPLDLDSVRKKVPDA